MLACWCITGRGPQPWPGLVLPAQGKWERGLCGARTGPITLPALEPPPPCEGRGMAVSTQLYRQETVALRAQGTGVRGPDHRARWQGARMLPSSPGPHLLHPRPSHTRPGSEAAASQDVARPPGAAWMKRPREDPSNLRLVVTSRTEWELDRREGLLCTASRVARKSGVCFSSQWVTSSSRKYHQDDNRKDGKAFFCCFLIRLRR